MGLIRAWNNIFFQRLSEKHKILLENEILTYKLEKFRGKDVINIFLLKINTFFVIDEI